MAIISHPKRAHYNEVSAPTGTGGLYIFSSLAYVIGAGIAGLGLLLLCSLVMTLDTAKPVQYFYCAVFCLTGLLMLIWGAVLHVVIAIKERD